MVERRTTILVVTDSALSRVLLVCGLMEGEYAVETATGGVQALEQLRERAFDLVLLDLLFSEFDNLEFLKRLQADESLREVPVVVAYSAERVEDAVRCLRSGAIDCLDRPFDPALLRVRVESALASKGLPRRGREGTQELARLAEVAAAFEKDGRPPEGLSEISTRPDALGKLAQHLQRLYRQVQRPGRVPQEGVASARPASRAGEAVQLSGTAASPPSPTTGAGKILVVDDGALNRRVLARSLQAEGYTVETAAGGQQALDLLAAQPFDVVLLDLLMPEMDGFQVLERMKADAQLQRLPVIIISAAEEMESIVRCIEMGATDYLPKPFEPALLQARISASLAAKRLRDQEIEYLQSVSRLTDAAALVEAEEFNPELLEENLADVAARPDALGQLARIFQHMASEVYARQQRLQQEVQELRIELDEARQRAKVAEITESTYFRNLDGIVLSDLETRIISVHSFRGGTGKSNLTANVATLLAMGGLRVGVIDADIQSPGIHTLFGMAGDEFSYTLNDFLWKECTIEMAAHDVTSNLDAEVPGRILLIPSSIKPGSIARVLRQGYDAQVLIQGFRNLAQELELNALLIDTHPGLNEETLLAVSISQTLVVVLRPDKQDYEGTGVTTQVARKLAVPRMVLVVNKVPAAFGLVKVKSQVEQAYGCEVAAVIPHCEEMTALASSGIFALRYPHHRVTSTLSEVASDLVGISIARTGAV